MSWLKRVLLRANPATPSTPLDSHPVATYEEIDGAEVNGFRSVRPQEISDAMIELRPEDTAGTALFAGGSGFARFHREKYDDTTGSFIFLFLELCKEDSPLLMLVPQLKFIGRES